MDLEEVYSLLSDFYEAEVWFKERAADARSKARAAAYGADTHGARIAAAISAAFRGDPLEEPNPGPHFDSSNIKPMLIRLIKASEELAIIADAMGLDPTPLVRFKTAMKPFYDVIPDDVETLLEMISIKAANLPRQAPAVALTAKAKEAAESIREHPGETGAFHAIAIHCTEEHFRRIIKTKLKPLGFYNRGGYFPPV